MKMSQLRVLWVMAASALLAACPEPRLPMPPAAPGSLTATALSSSSIQAMWSDNSDNEDSFDLEYSTSSSFGAWTDISVGAGSSSHLVGGLAASTTYYFRVRAVNDAGSSPYADTASAATPATPQAAPFAPGGLTVTPSSTSALQAGWTDNSTDEDNFVLQACTDSGFGAGVAEMTLAANTTSQLVDGLDADTLYYVRVKAVNVAGSSSWTGTVNARTMQLAEGTMTINSGAVMTKSRLCAITSNMTGAVQMRFQNAGEYWSEWYTYAATHSWMIPAGDGTKTVNAEFKDAGGGLVSKSDTILLHITPPAVTAFAIDDGAEYTVSRVVDITITATDDATPVQFRVSADGTTWSSWEMNKAVKENYQLPDGDGVKTVYAQVKDLYSNTTSVSDTITLDTQPPVVSSFSINNGATATSSSSVTLNNNVTGALEMRFQNSGGSWSAWEPYAATKAWPLSGGTGTKTVNAQFRDDALWTVPVSDSIVVDTTDPVVGSFSINNTDKYTATTIVTLNISVDGATEMRFQNSGGSWSGWEAYAATRSWTLTAGDATKTVNAEFRDAAANTTSASDSIILDATAPVGSISIEGGASATHTSAVTLTLNAPGAADMRFMNSGGAWSAWRKYATTAAWTMTAVENADSTVSAEFRDAAGNVSSPVSDSITFDAIRRLQITAQSIHVNDDDGDSVYSMDPGELYWGFYGHDTEGVGFPIYILPEAQYVTLQAGSDYDFPDVSVVVSLSNAPGGQFDVGFQLVDSDDPLSDDASSPSTNIYAYPDWGVGTRSISVVGSPNGIMYFSITLID